MKYNEVMALAEPVGKHVAISCKVTGIVAKDSDRLYFLTRGNYRCYLAKMSASQEHWYPEGRDPGESFEPTDKYAQWHMIEGPGYIGHFVDWEAVKRFLAIMRATSIEIESE